MTTSSLFSNLSNTTMPTLPTFWITRKLDCSRCNILQCPHFQVDIRCVHKWNTICVCPWGCAIHHLSCTAKPRVHTEMGQVFTWAHVGIVGYCTNENVKLDHSLIFVLNLELVFRTVIANLNSIQTKFQSFGNQGFSACLIYILSYKISTLRIYSIFSQLT